MADHLPKESEFLLYTTPQGEVNLQVLILDETVWLTQEGMQELFGRAKSTISEHISNVFQEGELEKESVVRDFRTTASDGKKYNTSFYNLDVIISVGYRVKSFQGTQFRIWATKTLREYIIKGFAIDDNRLKQAQSTFGKDYFRELLDRVRSIRASEQRIYHQVTQIFAECSIDYNPKSEITKNFYAMVQNKFHFAITGQTAAEIIHKRADSKKPKMGLTTYKNAPDGRVLRTDAKIAKNYLEEDEIKELERNVSGYFDYIENLIKRRNTFTMQGLAESVDKFLNFNEYQILEGKGRISNKQAVAKAAKEYDTFNKTQKIISDFEKHLKAHNNYNNDNKNS
ncbi:virulence RhuM family protein [Psychroflexus sp. ALD_RP9]|uniref:virulence RhuM family protein n=1 Tax=Psychroflexus sp. ALD_RP9 TaxID=2777186 RepID=UPI001A8CA57F|nr:virulence RhuM family protein [Psychroflexus sp. ALD_RP9]QSS96340.1 virulence RhuM family protein [Psychroflexus sp. ALD_RP9]